MQWLETVKNSSQESRGQLRGLLEGKLNEKQNIGAFLA